MKLLQKRVTSLAIGRFDGFHIGHLKLLDALNSNGAVLIIYRESDEFILPYEFIQSYIKFPIFSYKLSDIKHLESSQFLEKLYNDFPNLKKLVVGYDFFFGKERKYSANHLEESCKCQVKIVDEVKLNNISVHSGTIIKFLKDGQIEKANQLLGRAYAIIGNKIKGQGIGKKSVVPTINISFKKFVVPKHGVYLTKIYFKQLEFYSLSFIGVRETTDNSFAFETHILNGNIQDREFGTIKVEFFHFLRPNRKFKSLEELKEDVKNDIAKANQLFNPSL